jgi:hypothetical protein
MDGEGSVIEMWIERVETDQLSILLCSMRSLLSQTLENISPHLLRVLGSIDALPDTGLLVVAHNGLGLLVEGDEALLEGVGVVVGSLDQSLAGDIVNHLLLGGVEDLVVGSARGGVDQSAGDSGHQQIVGDLELHGLFEGLLLLREHFVELLSLGDGSGEAVQNEAVLALGVVLQLGPDHVHHNVVGNQTSGVHDLLGLHSKRSLLLDLGSQHVARRQMARAVLLHQVGGLGALAGAGGTNQNHSDGLGHLGGNLGLGRSLELVHSGSQTLNGSFQIFNGGHVVLGRENPDFVESQVERK